MAADRAVDGSRPLMSIPEAAVYVGLAPATLYEWARKGQLVGAVQINGRWRVKRAELSRWLSGEFEPRTE
jgi:excisionase family DNA binding protein